MGTISTSGAYGIAKLGIYAAQKAMEVTGNNITNINTEGYTRQRLDQKSLFMAGADRYSTKWEARVGGGVITTGVSQLRDPYLDIRYRTEMSSVGAYETRLKGLQQLAGVLDEVGKGEDDEGVFEAQFNDLIAQLTDMAASGAGKDSYDTLVQGSAKSLVSLFNTYANKLETIRKNTETSFGQDIATVNTILKKIQNLNDSIRKSDIHGGAGLELRDERNLLLDELSEYMSINVRYEMEPVGSGIEVEKLIVELNSNERRDETTKKSLGHDGQLLVSGEYVTQLNVHMESENPPKYGENYDIQLEKLTNIKGDVYKTPKKDADGKPQEDGKGNIIYEDSKDVWLTDNDLYGRLQSTRELLTEKGEFATNDDIDGATTAPPYVQNDASEGDIDANIKRGIPYYQKALDLMANKFAKMLNDANSLPDTFTFTTQVNADGEPIDAAGRVLIADPTNNKYYLKGQPETEGFPVFVDKTGQPVFTKTVKFDVNGNELTVDPNDPTQYLDKDGNVATPVQVDDGTGNMVDKTQTRPLTMDEMLKEGYIDKDGYLIKENIPEADYKKLVENPYYEHYKGGPLFSNNGNGNDTEGITAMNLSISNGWATGAVHVLQTKQAIDPDRPQSTQQDNIQHILSIVADNNLDYRPSDLYPIEDGADIKTDSDYSPSWETAFFTGSFQDFLTDMCSTLADDTRVTSGRMNNYVSSVNDLYGDRDSVSGVDLNDEAIAMMQYNKAYSASCRLLTTLDEMIDKLVNGTAI